MENGWTSWVRYKDPVVLLLEGQNTSRTTFQQEPETTSAMRNMTSYIYILTKKYTGTTHTHVKASDRYNPGYNNKKSLFFFHVQH